jgi:murein DD-endopeptidase MepM/ murein hydrolase activator NlpD
LAEEQYFSGNVVLIDHGVGMYSFLAHLSRIDVREGQRVEAGQPIGLAGATGRVSGPHLHWTVRLNQARVDPLGVLEILGEARR